MFGYVSGTRVEWLTLENSSSGLKLQDVLLKDLLDALLFWKFELGMDCARDIKYFYIIVDMILRKLRDERNISKFIEWIFEWISQFKVLLCM